MNTKAIALVMAAIVAVSVATVVLVDDSYGADPESKTVYVANGDSVTVDFVITEPDKDYYTNVPDWKVDGTSIYGASKSANINNADGEKIATISVAKTDNKAGGYTATIAAESDATGTADIVLNYELKTKVTNSTGEVTQTISYNVKVVVIGSPINGATLDGLKAGQAMTPVSVVKEDVTDDYVYYALGLPKGMQMAPNGVISGTPLNPSTGEDAKESVTIIATHVESNIVFSKTIEFTVGQADDHSFDFTVSSNATTITDEKKYIVVQGTENVTVNTTVGSSPADIDYVYIIDANGGQTDATKAGTGSYSIPTDGSGEYRIVMVNGDVVKSFSLTVVAIVYDVSTGIGFTPASP